MRCMHGALFQRRACRCSAPATSALFHVASMHARPRPIFALACPGSTAAHSPRGSRLRVQAFTTDEMLSHIERLRREVDDLEAELREASATGEQCARRSKRLRARSKQLADYALEHVLQGDEEGARSALRIKASVREALEGATQRALANVALATKLERVIEQKQLRLLQLIREARAELERRSGGDAAKAEKQRRELRIASSGAWRERDSGGAGSSSSSSSSKSSRRGGSEDGFSGFNSNGWDSSIE